MGDGSVDGELLKTFLEVHRTRHFARAAENLFVTPSAVSARIRLLEGQLGTPLFVRRRNHVDLTPAGERLLGHAGALLERWARARQELALGESGMRPLMAAATPGLWEALLTPWLTRLCRERPELAVSAEVLPSPAIPQALLQRRIHLGFSYDPFSTPELTLRQVAQLRLRLYASTADTPLEAALAAGYRLVDWGGRFLRLHAERFPEAPPPAGRVATPGMALALLGELEGAAYLTPALAQRCTRPLHPVAAAPGFELPVYTLCAADGESLEGIDEVLELIP